jgi:hypothetical protein
MATLPPLYDEGAAGLFILELNFRPVIESRYLAVALPKFNVVAINKLLSLFLGLGIIGAFEWNRAVKMAV